MTSIQFKTHAFFLAMKVIITPVDLKKVNLFRIEREMVYTPIYRLPPHCENSKKNG